MQAAANPPPGAGSLPLVDARGRLGVVDYGMGNLASVERAVRRVAPAVQLCRVRTPEQLEGQDALILPGVGAFDAAMGSLERCGLREGLQRYLEQGRPLLGICLGFQILYEASEEVPAGRPDCRGLGWLAGRVRRFPPHVTVPHMGWNRLELSGAPSPLFDGLASGIYVYFAHSYAVPVWQDAGWQLDEPGPLPQDVVAIARTGRPDGSTPVATFVAAAWRGSAGGVQFHPEKSSRVGLTILANYLRRALSAPQAVPEPSRGEGAPQVVPEPSRGAGAPQAVPAPLWGAGAA